MSHDTKQDSRPVMSDPGGDGWAIEPKVTDAERALYGELAGVIRRLGEASIAAEDAYSLMCKHATQDPAQAEEAKAYTLRAGDAWDVHAGVRKAYAETALWAAQLQSEHFHGMVANLTSVSEGEESLRQ